MIFLLIERGFMAKKLNLNIKSIYSLKFNLRYEYNINN